jgi:hypothetical protein
VFTEGPGKANLRISSYQGSTDLEGPHISGLRPAMTVAPSLRGVKARPAGPGARAFCA